MARVNERCIEHTADEYRVKGYRLCPGAEVLAASQDVNGAKIHCCWIRVDQAAEASFDYLSLEGEFLEERGPFPLEVGKYTRFQFGTYQKELALPVMGLRVRVRNISDQDACVTIYGMSQLQ